MQLELKMVVSVVLLRAEPAVDPAAVVAQEARRLAARALLSAKEGPVTNPPLLAFSDESSCYRYSTSMASCMVRKRAAG